MREFTISGREAGQRMDKYLFKVLDRAPGGFIYKMLRKKNIVLNGKKASGKEILKEQDSVKFFLSDETFAKFASVIPEDRCSKGEFKASGNSMVPSALKIVYEDEDILVINKPAGLLSQKAAAGDDSANDRIIAYLLSSGQLSEAELRTFHPSICNRLDRNTSGLLIAGKTMRGLQEMAKQLKDRSAKKFYHTLVWGKVTKPQKLCGYLVKDHRTNQVKVCLKNPGEDTDAEPGDSERMRIETEYVPLAYYGGATLLEVHLITGRSHQIRAHLAAAGYPLLGDAKYGNADLNRRLFHATGIRSQLLHACRIELSDGRVIEAEDPDEFRKAENWLRRQVRENNP